mgnify:CR=1 FL=1
MTPSEGYKFFQIPDMVAANGLLVNDTLIRRHNEEFPNSIQAFEEVDEFVTSHDGIVVPIKADELAKMDGARKCGRDTVSCRNERGKTAQEVMNSEEGMMVL